MTSAPSIRDAVVAAGKASARLGELDTQLLDAISDIEERLRQLVATRLEVSLGDGRTLAFGKINGHWSLLVAGDGPTHTVALRSASRDLRARVFADGSVLRLITSAADQLDERINERKLALASASDLMALLGGRAR